MSHTNQASHTIPAWPSDGVVRPSGFDVFVISSLYEGLGRALTEAITSARPVVATAVNGVPDLIIPSPPTPQGIRDRLGNGAQPTTVMTAPEKEA
jgi:hypothetical protein